MKLFLLKLLTRTRRALWAVLLAYMLGVHNFYNGDTQTPEDLNNRNKKNEMQEDGAPR